MQHRNRFKQTATLEERLANQASRLRERAKQVPPGMKREWLLQKARQAETSAHLSEWLHSPSLQLPKQKRFWPG